MSEVRREKEGRAEKTKEVWREKKVGLSGERKGGERVTKRKVGRSGGKTSRKRDKQILEKEEFKCVVPLRSF